MRSDDTLKRNSQLDDIVRTITYGWKHKTPAFCDIVEINLILSKVLVLFDLRSKIGMSLYGEVYTEHAETIQKWSEHLSIRRFSWYETLQEMKH